MTSLNTSHLNGTFHAPRNIAHLRGLPENRAELLKESFSYRVAHEGLENTYLEGLIQDNIINQNDGSLHGMLVAQVDACDARALYNSLSEDGKQKFLKLLRAFHISITEDKDRDRNKKMFEGMMELYQGGEIRVVAESGFRALVKTLLDLLGIKPKHFYGVSAGGFQAAGRAFGAPNCISIANTSSTDYSQITKSRKHLEVWINDLIKEAYCFTTGKKEHEIKDGIIRVKHLEELGTNLQVLVGEFTKYFPPRMESYFQPGELKNRLGINPSNLPLAPLIAASANLWGLFFLIDPTFGQCFVRDSKGLPHYQLDPGLDRVNGIPLQDFETGIKEYINGKRELPPFALISGNRRIESIERGVYDKAADVMDSFSTDPFDKIKTLNSERLYSEAFCAVKDPFIKGNYSIIRTGHLKMSVHDKENIIAANIPTINFTEFRFQNLEFKPTLDQFYNNLVDEEYVRLKGERGKSPFQLYIDDVDKLKLAKKNEKLPEEIIPINNTVSMDKATFEARMLWTIAC